MPNAAEQQYNYQTTAITPAPTNHTPEERAYLSELFSSQMYDNLFSDLFTSSFQKNPTIPGQHFHQDPAAVLTDRLESTALGPVQPQGVYFDSPVQLAIPPLSFAADGFGDFLPDGSLQIAIPPLVTVEQPTPEELNEYRAYSTCRPETVRRNFVVGSRIVVLCHSEVVRLDILLTHAAGTHTDVPVGRTTSHSRGRYASLRCNVCTYAGCSEVH